MRHIRFALHQRPGRGCDITLECAIGRLLLAIERLGENPPDKKPGTYFEASPSKDPEAYKRWVELNDAGAFIHKTLAARKSSESDAAAKSP